MTPLIRIEGLAFSYEPDASPPVNALRDICLEIREGERLALLGANGSGKSTLARCLNALLIPTRGDVFVCGLNTRQRQNWLEIRQTVGVVFQNPDNQFVCSTVEEEIAFGPENLGVPVGVLRIRVDEALEQTDLQAFAHANPHELSAGRKARVALASVIAMRPRCVLLDEATAYLDPRARAEMLLLLETMRASGMTLIDVTHDMDLAAMADRTLVLDGGAMVFDGTPRALFSRGEWLQAVGLGRPTHARVSTSLAGRGLAMPLCLNDTELLSALLQIGQRA